MGILEIAPYLTSTAGRKSKVKSQKSKRIQYRLLGDLSWLVYLRRSVLVDAIALNLHGFYTGVERIFQVIANQIDYRKPTSDKWHSELLEQMSVDLPGIRQAVISENALLVLDELRRFRHVVRSVYSYQLKEQRVLDVVNQVFNFYDDLIREIEYFCDSLSLETDR